MDPNFQNGIEWYLARASDRGGSDTEALLAIARHEKSCWTQIRLAWQSLQEGDLSQACAYYQESLGRMTDPIDADALVEISGDLGKQGHLQKLLDETCTSGGVMPSTRRRKNGVIEDIADSNDLGLVFCLSCLLFKSMLHDEATAIVEQPAPLWYDVPKECSSEYLLRIKQVSLLWRWCFWRARDSQRNAIAMFGQLGK